MRISEYIPASIALAEAGLVPCGVGAPGIGKTEGVMNEWLSRAVRWLSQSVPLLGPQYVTGYPYRQDGRADHAAFGLLHEAFQATTRLHLHWADLGAGSESTIKELLQLFQFRHVHGKRLPDCVSMSADSNDVAQGAGVMGLLEPMKDRVVLLPVETTAEDLVRHGLANGWPGWYLGWLRNEAKAFWDWKPGKNLVCSGPTPRGHADVCRMIKAGVMDRDCWAGRIGKGYAASAWAFHELQAELPDVDSCLVDPQGAPVPENPGAKWLVSMALASRMNGKNFGQAITYLKRLPMMFLAASFLDAHAAENERRKQGKLPKGYPIISSSDEYTAFAMSTEGKTILGAHAKR